jgi:hypothetical protein
MAKTVRAILGDIYDAWRAQNLDWLGGYLPDDFCHVIHVPVELHPLGGARRGKKEALARLQLIVAEFHFDEIDTSDLLVERNRAAVEVPIRYATGQPGNRRAVRIDQGQFLDAGRRLAGEAHRVSRHRARSGLCQRRRRRASSMRGDERSALPPAL